MQYFPDKYFEIQAIKKPNYEILENCNTKSGKVLIIFNPNNRNECHEYAWKNDRKAFRCLSCDTTAHIHNASLENEYIELSKLIHECEHRNYDREKYFKFKNFVLPGNFEIQTKKFGEREKKLLIIFDESDKTKCHKYYNHLSQRIFRCVNCRKQNVRVSAKMVQNSDGEDYVILLNEAHVCEMVKYKPQKKNDITILATNFKVMEKTSNGIPKIYQILNFVRAEMVYQKENWLNNETNEKFLELSKNEHICEPIKDEFADKIIHASNFIVTERDDEKKPKKVIVFTSSTKEFYYELNYFPSKNLFRCILCSIRNKVVGAKLCKKENGEEYLLMLKNEHVCTPKKYEKEKFQPKTVPKSMFELYQNKNSESNKKLIVFTSEKKDFVYEYYWQKSSFCCLQCLKQKKYVRAKVRGENENEKFVELSNVEHITRDN
uniref:Uncharacterized protein n=1 Tax=Panagrolaimus davidi TaxID=227884 RepID=A0A914QYU8_9BILA